MARSIPSGVLLCSTKYCDFDRDRQGDSQGYRREMRRSELVVRRVMSASCPPDVGPRFISKGWQVRVWQSHRVIADSGLGRARLSPGEVMEVSLRSMGGEHVAPL